MLDNKLETLLSVCETKSFTKTAARLELTQPAVSHHIKQLEQELGIKIFLRGEGELHLTEEGEILVKYAKRIRALYQNLSAALTEKTSRLRHLVIGVTRSAERNVLVDVFARYCGMNDSIRLTIISDTVDNLYARLKTYELDLAVIEGRIQDENLNYVLLDTDYLVLAVSNDNPLAAQKQVTLEELKKEKMILRLPNSGTRNLFLAHLESRGQSIDAFNVILEVDSVTTIKELVTKNFGVSVLARSVCRQEISQGTLTVLPVENLSMSREINIAYHKDFEHKEILGEITRMYTEMSKIHQG